MPTKDRKSPRDSIKQWLFATSETKRPTSEDPCVQGPFVRQRNADETRLNHRRSSKRRRKECSLTGDVEPHWQSAVEDTARHFVARTSAAKPDLQAPFRNFTYESTALAEETNKLKSPRNRRRADTRKSPSLEPAATIDLAAGRSDRDEHFRYSPELARGKKRKKLAASDPPSPRAPAHLPPSRPPDESYRRRRRHKTRDDRFTLKEARRSGEHFEKEHDLVRKPTKRRRAEKTGAALVHEFNASNVPQERLTVRCLSPTETNYPIADESFKLKGSHQLGLFAKGKASSPKRRRACKSRFSPTPLPY